jgi:hypothetical protein
MATIRASTVRHQAGWRTILPALLAIIALASCDRAAQPPPADMPTLDYAYGTKLLFGKSGNAEGAKVSGWHPAEDEFTWTEATTAVLGLKVPAGAESVTMHARMAGMIKEPQVRSQPVQVLVNNKKVADWNVGNTAEFNAKIPADIVKNGGPLQITFKVLQAKSPKELGVSEDARVLGVRIYDLDLRRG